MASALHHETGRYLVLVVLVVLVLAVECRLRVSLLWIPPNLGAIENSHMRPMFPCLATCHRYLN